jgi:methyl-accepting chemotaxis protein
MVINVSTVVEENATPATQMQINTQSVMALMVPIATTSESHAATAEEVSASAVEMAAQIREMDDTATTIRTQADRLTALLSKFTIRAPKTLDQSAAKPRRELAPQQRMLGKAA